MRLLLLSALALTLGAQPKPDFTGTWKLNEAASPSTAGGAQDIVFKIEHKEPHCKYSATGKHNFYARFSEEFEFTTDGKLPADHSKVAVSGRWEGRTLILDYYKGGKQIFRYLFRLSPDGRQMMREADRPEGRKIREVYDRQ